MRQSIFKRHVHKARYAFYVYVAFCVLCCFCNAADVVYISTSTVESAQKDSVGLACEFYGLNIERLSVEEGSISSQLSATLKKSNSRAIVINSKALSNIDVSEAIFSLHRNRVDKIPLLLIIGVTSDIDPKLLSNFSKGAVTGCRSNKNIQFNGFYKVSDLKVLAKQLSGLETPLYTQKVDYLILDKSRDVQTIVEVGNSNKEAGFPIFVKFMLTGQEVFCQTPIQFPESSAESVLYSNRHRFLEIAPLMMFLRYAFGERCWNSPGYYANLTIDDPWLTEPYGHLSYRGLLEQMDKANFHTTIAFIPWNYDRSETDVVSLFKEHPDRLSLCVHGNNHDHYEFYKYETNTADPWPAKPLNVQETNIKQAIARLEEFKKLTGLSYDRVMVFPHLIAPAKTLGLLKKYNFLATSNAGNVPLGSEKPTDPLFYLRPITLDFENFLSFNRHSVAERSKADIAIDLFLDNPVLLFEHHNFFAGSIDAFNEMAEVVHSLEPSVEWHSLAYIARHLYLQRARYDGNYDVRAFCKSVELENRSKRALTYFVRKEESFSLLIRQVTVDGQPYSYEKSNNNIRLTVTIPPGGSRLIDIEYENDLDLTSVDISKNDPRVNRLRKLSDFRDMTLSTNMLGRAFTRVYYETGLFKLGLKRLATICFAMAVAVCLAGWYLLRRIKKHRLQKVQIDE